MPFDSPRHQTRRANLVAALQLAGGPTKLAALLHKPDLRGHLSNIRDGKRGMGDDLAAQIESALELGPGWMDRQHLVAGESPNAMPAAHVLSHRVGSDALPYIAWHLIVGQTVPAVFRTTLPDDALAPDYPGGTEIVWTTRRRPAPGRLILVKDRHGQAHARQCHQGRLPGQWLAAPLNPAFITFDSHEDGVELLAVYKGRLEPDD